MGGQEAGKLIPGKSWLALAIMGIVLLVAGMLPWMTLISIYPLAQPFMLTRLTITI